MGPLAFETLTLSLTLTLTITITITITVVMTMMMIIIIFTVIILRFILSSLGVGIINDSVSSIRTGTSHMCGIS